MKELQLILLFTLTLILGCRNNSQNTIGNIHNDISIIANSFIDAFYSFDSKKLENVLTMAPESQPAILYYQKWAECGNYKIMKRNVFLTLNDSMIKCPITVKDDLIGALGLDFNVTDTFHLKILNGRIHSVTTSSNDPDMYFEAKEWVTIYRPEMIEKPCEGMMDDGPTPCECVRAMIKGFTEFIASEESE